MPIINSPVPQVDDAAESIMQQDKDKFSSYKFEIMEDDNIYSISFRGKLANKENAGINTELFI